MAGILKKKKRKILIFVFFLCCCCCGIKKRWEREKEEEEEENDDDCDVLPPTARPWPCQLQSCNRSPPSLSPGPLSISFLSVNFYLPLHPWNNWRVASDWLCARPSVYCCILPLFFSSFGKLKHKSERERELITGGKVDLTPPSRLPHCLYLERGARISSLW